MAMRQFDEAILSFSHLIKVSNQSPLSQNGLIITYCMMGKFEQARELRNELRSGPKDEYTGYALEALSIAYLDGADEALKYLEKAYDEREPVLLTLKYSGVVSKTLKEHPRFQLLLENIGFP